MPDPCSHIISYILLIKKDTDVALAAHKVCTVRPLCGLPPLGKVNRQLDIAATGPHIYRASILDAKTKSKQNTTRKLLLV